MIPACALPHAFGGVLETSSFKISVRFVLVLIADTCRWARSWENVKIYGRGFFMFWLDLVTMTI
jgi:hypothetical protein